MISMRKALQLHERGTAPKQEDGADDDEQLHELIAGDDLSQDIPRARAVILPAVEIWMDDSRHGRSVRALTPLPSPKLLIVERK